MPLALEHGEERWGPIQAWLAEVGNDGLQRALSGLDKDRDYHAWLSEQLGQSTEAVEWGAENKGHVSLDALRADVSRESGYRAATAPGLQKKMKDFVLAGRLHDWDIAILCQAAEQPERPEGWKPMYFKFHYRGVAMHALAYSFYARKLDLSAFLVDMFKRIPFEWKGSVTKVERVSRGVAIGASMMKHSTINYSWVDTILQIYQMPPSVTL